jgi:hypothetical protein
MITTKLWKLGVLGVALFSMLGDTCVKDKIVEIVIGADVQAEFIASGELNTHDDTDTIDVKEDLDLANILDDNDIDPNDIDEAPKVSGLFYRITQAEAGRSITNGNLMVQRGSGAAVTLASGWSAEAFPVTPDGEWIDVTYALQSGGVQMLNAFLEECLIELKGGAPATNTVFTYAVSGDSVPADVATDFQYRVKITFQAKLPFEATVIDF